MKKLIIAFQFVFLTLTAAQAQILDPVDWSFETKKTGEKTYELIMKASIDEGWHIYAQKLEGEGPIPTSFSFEENENVDFKGKVQPLTKVEEKFEEAFGIQVRYFHDEAIFSQKVKIKDAVEAIKGSLRFMTCNDGRCLAPATVPFTFKINSSSKTTEAVKEKKSESEPKERDEGNFESFGFKNTSSGNDKTEPQANGIEDPVHWSYSFEKIKDDRVKIILKAEIEDGWHIYGTKKVTGPDGMGPIPTSFNFNENESLRFLGRTRAKSKEVKAFDPNFEIELSYFEESARFEQLVNLKKTDLNEISGELEYMACNDRKCLPPETIEFSVDLTKEEGVFQGEKQEVESKNVDSENSREEGVNKVEKKDEEKEEKKGLLGIFIAGFLGGFVALLTPCVFPMIPLTVSFFTKQSKNRAKGIINAFVYGFSIIAIYVILGMLITLIFGADALNSLASNVWMNLAFFVVFMVFAASFLGAFEITLPSSLVNKADEASNRGGLIGIFFMAFTLSLVSFSCTGPIIGTLLVEAAVAGAKAGPAIGMFGFSLALALPFGLFAAFPGWLNSLPKSGGWLNSVKVVLGLLEIALAMKFISNVDLAYHWNIITREVFIAIWIVVFSLIGFYLLGKLKFSHDMDVPYVSVPRAFMSIIVFAFVVYLVPGMWGAPLKLISGFPPPEHYNEGWSAGGRSSAETDLDIIAAGAHPEKCPHNLPCFHDYDKALKYSQKVNKPLFVDFTGYSCVNCRKMEDKVWSDPEVLAILREDYILASLYVDDKEELPEDEQYISDFSGKKVETIGNKWSDFQASSYKANSQPFYVLLDGNEEKLAEPVGYTPSVEEYLEFLRTGLKEYKKGS